MSRRFLLFVSGSFLLLGFLGLACVVSGPDSSEPDLPSYGTKYVSTPEHLLRISMSLRGVRPSLKEYQQLKDKSESLESLVEKYLDTPHFGTMIREMHAEWLLINVSPDYYPAAFPALDVLQGVGLHKLNQSLISAAPRLVEHIVTSNRSYKEVVTAPYTMADSIVASVWGIPYDKAKGGWQKTKYGDGRPPAGVLNDGFMFTRHASTSANRNRGRAQQIARIFLCVDYTNREIDLKGSLDLSDEKKVREAVRKNPVCNSCHQTLDPLASFFASHYPLRLPDREKRYPLKQYAPEFIEFYRTAKPAFFGKPGKNLKDLGTFIANDPRFASCITRRFYAQMMDLDVSKVSRKRVEYFSRLFVHSGMKVKSLLKAIVLSDDFRLREGRDKDAAVRVGYRRIKPNQLSHLFEELTGFRWETDLDYNYGGRIGKINLTTDSFFGYRLLAGGSDGYDVWTPARTMNPTTLLVLRGLAARSVKFVVEKDFGKSKKERRLFRLVDANTTDEASVRKQIASWHLRFYGKEVPSSDPSVEKGWKLFQAIHKSKKDSRRAWSVLLYAMLRDIRILYY
jgi:hypothetical protein